MQCVCVCVWMCVNVCVCEFLVKLSLCVVTACPLCCYQALWVVESQKSTALTQCRSQDSSFVLNILKFEFEGKKLNSVIFLFLILLAEELFRARSSFVDLVSEVFIHQLLDDVFTDGVVCDEERRSILEKNRNRHDTARCLIDTVMLKGDAASRTLINHIQLRDPTLYSALSLSCGPPAPPGEPTGFS